MRIVLAGAAHAARPPQETGIQTLWEWIEEHGIIVYPVVLISMVILIGGALVASWHSQDISATQRGELKMKIMSIMRRRVSGVSAEVIAAELQIDLMLAAKLLADLASEGLVVAMGGSTSSEAVRYRLRGVS
jgi:hypothetical protein